MYHIGLSWIEVNKKIADPILIRSYVAMVSLYSHAVVKSIYIYIFRFFLDFHGTEQEIVDGLKATWIGYNQHINDIPCIYTIHNNLVYSL